MAERIGFFQKRTEAGDIELSLGRLQSAACVFSGIGLSFISVLKPSGATYEDAMICLTLVGLGITGKVVSGGLEGRHG